MLVPQKIHYTLCTGNLCTREVEEYLRSICVTDVNIVTGDMDTGVCTTDFANVLSFRSAPSTTARTDIDGPKV